MTWRGVARKAIVAVGVAAGVVAALASPAPAQAPDRQGWWWLAGATGIAPPGVPADGLYVAANPSGAQGVSALRFTLAGGGGAGTLRLDLAGSASGTPVLGLCRVAPGWKPAQGGALAEAPTCAGGPTVQGQPTADGRSFTFAVGSLATDGVLDVAVVPGAGSTFSVAFSKPAADALAAAGGGAGEPATSGDPAPSPAAEPSPSFSPSPSFVAPAPAFEPQPPDAPITGSAPRPVAPSGPSPVALGPAQAASDDGGGGSLRIAGFVVLALTAVAYHRLSTTPDRPPRSLVSFGQLAVEEPS